ncbi:MAG: RAD55 family ATPase, partial [Thermoproteota archaeon]
MRVKDDTTKPKIGYPYIRLGGVYQNMAKPSTVRVVEDELVRTGIDGLDKVLGGGIPRGRCVLVMGGPGTGKTTLSIQFLYNGAIEYGENGIYITLQESPEHIRKDMLKIGLDFEILEEEDRLRIIDYSASTYLSSISERIVGYSSE